MNEQELIQARRHKWHLYEPGIRTLEDAREFIESVGFCLMYPLPPAEVKGPVPTVPTFIGAFMGNDANLPTWKQAFRYPEAAAATELMVRLLRDKGAYEANLFGETNFLVSASIFPFFYGLVGDRNPRQMPKPGTRSEYSPLARDAFEVIREHGAISKQRLGEKLGGSVSNPALDHALGELWSRLRITRVDYREGEGGIWDALYRYSPDAVREGMHISIVEALTALLSKYLDCVVASDQQEIADFFSHFIGRSKVNEALGALLSARELSFVQVGMKSCIQITPPRAKR
jgi:hypothetical protein